jgi:hypothetical protein
MCTEVSGGPEESRRLAEEPSSWFFFVCDCSSDGITELIMLKGANSEYALRDPGASLLLAVLDRMLDKGSPKMFPIFELIE